MSRVSDLRNALVGFGANRATLMAFSLFVLIGGSNAVAVRFSNLELPPFWGTRIRFATVALIFWVIVLVRRITLPRGRALVGAVVYGILATGTSYAFIYWALLRVQASVTMVVLAFAPLITLFLARGHRLEQLTRRRFIGALITSAASSLPWAGGWAPTCPCYPYLPW
jgi:drug/metabolite transporter (DMT)-like permease